MHGAQHATVACAIKCKLATYPAERDSVKCTHKSLLLHAAGLFAVTALLQLGYITAAWLHYGEALISEMPLGQRVLNKMAKIHLAHHNLI